MKITFRFLSFVYVFIFCAAFIACSSNSADGGFNESSAIPQITDSGAQPSGITNTSASDDSPEPMYEEEYFISGFDIRTIGEYPEIERAIRIASGKYDGEELVTKDFLRVTEINLDDTGIKDLTPLAGMTNLKYLRLSHNGIDDLSPLAGLVNLKTLYLRMNNITDISPLAKMTELISLDLLDNQIEDISPLSGMDKITDATLSMNKISDLTPLAGWKSIERLSLNSNPIKDITPLSELDSLLQVYLVDCPVKDFSPVAHVSFVEPYERKAVVLNKENSD